MITKEDLTENVFNTIYNTLKLDKNKDTVWDLSLTDLGATDKDKNEIIRIISQTYNIQTDIRVMISLSRFSEIIAKNLLERGGKIVLNNINENSIPEIKIEPTINQEYIKSVFDKNKEMLKPFFVSNSDFEFSGLSKEITNKYRELCNIPKIEKLIFVSQTNFNEDVAFFSSSGVTLWALIITDISIYSLYHSISDPPIFSLKNKEIITETPSIKWSNIKQLEVKKLYDFEKKFIFNGNNNDNVVINAISLNDKFIFVGEIIKEIFTNIQNNTIAVNSNIKKDEIKQIETSYIEKIKTTIKDENWDLLLTICNEITEKDKKPNFEIYYYRSFANLKLNKFSECLKFYKICKELFQQNYGYFTLDNNWSVNIKEIYYKINLLEIEIYKKENNIFDTLWKYNECLNIETDVEEKFDLKEKRNETYLKVMNDFGNINFAKRKVILLEEDLPLFKTTNILPLNISSIGELKFPPNHPKKGQLYVGHPFRSNIYYPIEIAENQIFESQVTELTRVLQSLGAMRIEIEHVQGEKGSIFNSENNSNYEKNNLDISAKVDVKIHKVNAEYGHKSEKSNETEKLKNYQNTSNKRMSITQTFEITSEIGLPFDLIWYHHNEVWQSIANQRLDGKLLSSEIVLSSEKSEVLNEKELKTIEEEYHDLVKAGYKNLAVGVSAGLKKDKEIENTQKSEIKIHKMETTIWKVYVEFAPLERIKSKQITPQQQVNLGTPDKVKENYNENENDYIELLKVALEDDIITKEERRYLEKKQVDLNISSSKALELETMMKAKNKFSDNELKYADEIKFIIKNNGKISNDERNILNKQKQKLNISDQKAFEIETEILNSIKKKGFFSNLFGK